MTSIAYAAGVLAAAPKPAAPVDNNDTGWTIGFVLFGVVVAAVVALVVPILLLANRIGRQAPPINASLQQSQEHTAGLAGLETTIDSVAEIVGGLKRARVQLGG
ncbi:MAG: hypothetical protein ACT4QF_09850 [Sporichthyaceae bacterium]